MKEFPQANIRGTPIGGSTGCFEVLMNGQKLHSKLGGMGVVTEKNVPALYEKIRGQMK